MPSDGGCDMCKTYIYLEDVVALAYGATYEGGSKAKGSIKRLKGTKG